MERWAGEGNVGSTAGHIRRLSLTQRISWGPEGFEELKTGHEPSGLGGKNENWKGL